MKGPSIAVMLGAPKHDDEDEAGEPGLGETKEAAKDAAKALAQAVAAKDPEAIVRSFRALSTLCHESEDLEESGESDEEKKDEGESSDEG